MVLSCVVLACLLLLGACLTGEPSAPIARTAGAPVDAQPTALAAPGTRLNLMVRGQALPALVTPLPFVPHTYKRTDKKC